MLTQPATITPSAGLLASVAAWFWIDPTKVGHVAFLLIAHPPGRRPGESPQMVEARMRGLADALTLAEPAALLPDIGPRLFMHRESDALLRLDGCDYLLHVPIGGGWARFVCDGGTVTVVVGLDPLPVSSSLEVVDAYITERATQGRLLLGKTRADRPRHSIKPGAPPV
ncbi:hypothetical protein NLX86_28550 [Streptomyces sp. A3M-1-3]|uniref:hypothetical protein n=1 Tax=Streptomyces sp. A3M-1-3 TaxID=2962044 RepID=UPI0020B7EF84|nr:hypothetical protein [Streptomyces sp. A3M-1-3]MCP3821900.1 hypothetical protein [Streptomyces sp. A3M-1-3]